MDSWDSYQAVEAARLHLVEGLSFTQIGETLGASRFRVARLVASARKAGWVEVRVSSPPGVDAGLTREFAELCREQGIPRALVTPDSDGRLALERAAANAVESTTKNGDVVGFACGMTVNRVVAAIRRMPQCEVVQLTGLAYPGRFEDSSVETIRRAARLTGTQVRPVFEPMVQATPVAARQRRTHPSLLRAFARWERITNVLLTMGAWVPGESNVYDAEALEDAVRKRATHAGAVAELCGHLLDADGRVVAEEITARCLTVPLERLLAAREVIAVAARPERSAAVRAAMRTDLITTLVATEGVARSLLSHG
jgi:DNA-binding transcriptional regulator LsrR (DeoR family)